ncbi:MAG TPA: hypothetical protein VGQ20_03475 [Acidimicrobiales bacterium]|jgi:hypothetical protein|nr:hypothetical protein [Acidimicrobiales bacterium]
MAEGREHRCDIRLIEADMARDEIVTLFESYERKAIGHLISMGRAGGCGAPLCRVT